jgi:hypothetical protein
MILLVCHLMIEWWCHYVKPIGKKKNLHSLATCSWGSQQWSGVLIQV